ncbi:MAG: type restriction enzyme protein [Acidobacteriota bacterium]|nr:type restriction enzyme protein [Acidobacteriota bacterium]
MVTNQLKGAVEELWNLFRSAGITNPLSAMEQISYLIALRWWDKADGDIEELPAPFGKATPRRWSALKKARAAELPGLVESAFEGLRLTDQYGEDFSAAMRDASLRVPKANILKPAIEMIDKLPFGRGDADTPGQLYEELLSLAFSAGKHTQFRTPRHVVETMVELADPQDGERVCDPAAGTGGFLISAYRRVYDAGSVPSSESFTGFDFDTTMVRLGIINMIMHGIRRPSYKHQDMLGVGPKLTRKYNLVLSFLPFGGKVERAKVDKRRLTLPTNRTELLFIEQSLALLRGGGRCAVVVPEGVMSNEDPDCRELRRRLVEGNRLEAVVSLPRGTFLPYTAVKTAILLMTKGGRTDRVWFYDVMADGYTLDDGRVPNPGHNDLKFVPQAYRVMVGGAQEKWAAGAKDVAEQRSLSVGRAEIAAHDYSLTSDLYRRAAQEVAREDIRAILTRILDLQSQIRRKVKSIEAKLPGVLDA